MNRIVQYLACFTVIGMMMGTAEPASAQRTASSQNSLAISALLPGKSVGAEAFFQQYTLNGYWEAGLYGADFSAPLSIGDNLRYWDVSARGGYQFRIAATRGRGLNWYLGGGVQAGIEYLDPLRALPSYYDLGRSRISFQYGLYAATVLEIFLGMKVAILVTGELPVSFAPCIKHLHPAAGLGLKYLFN